MLQSISPDKAVGAYRSVVGVSPSLGPSCKILAIANPRQYRHYMPAPNALFISRRFLTLLPHSFVYLSITLTPITSCQPMETHTHTHCQIQFHLMYCQIMLLISLQQILKKQQIISQAHLLHRVLTHCVFKKFQ